MAEPRIESSGPQPAEILLVGEAPGESEIAMGKPFVGVSGQELKRMLEQADVDPKSCRMTNVFMTRPGDKNDIETYCVPKAETARDYPYPAYRQGKYFREDLLSIELPRLAAEIKATAPKLVIALGNTATWALLGKTGINKLRGNLFETSLAGAEGFPVIPTYHPAAILRQWGLRVVGVHDLLKCNRFVREGFNRPHRRLILDPTMDEVEGWFSEFFRNPAPLTSLDIETKKGTITCLGFAGSSTDAICVPFHDPGQEDGNFWRDAKSEVHARELCRRLTDNPDWRKIGQNGLYDIQYLFLEGFRLRGYTEDTMIRHHSLYPELEKGLGFMGTIYTDEAPWKLMRPRNKDNFKLEDE